MIPKGCYGFGRSLGVPRELTRRTQTQTHTRAHTHLDVTQHPLAVDEQERPRHTLLPLRTAPHIPPGMKQADTRRVVHEQRHTAVLPVRRGSRRGDAADSRQENQRDEEQRCPVQAEGGVGGDGGVGVGDRVVSSPWWCWWRW